MRSALPLPEHRPGGWLEAALRRPLYLFTMTCQGPHLRQVEAHRLQSTAWLPCSHAQCPGSEAGARRAPRSPCRGLSLCLLRAGMWKGQAWKTHQETAEAFPQVPPRCVHGPLCVSCGACILHRVLPSGSPLSREKWGYVNMPGPGRFLSESKCKGPSHGKPHFLL